MSVRAPARKPRRQRMLKADGTPRAPRVDWEGQEQAVLIRWLLGEQKRGTPVGDLYDVVYHVPNGGQRNKKTAADLKRQGVKAGVSDLVAMDARGGWHGLYLEFKATPPRHAALAPSQREWLALADGRRYCAVHVRGLEDAKQALIEYASWPRTQVVGEPMVMQSGTEWRTGVRNDGNGSTGTDSSEG